MSLDIDIPTPELETAQVRGLKGYSQALADHLFASPRRIISSIGVIIASLCIIAWNVSRLSILDELVLLEIQEYQLDDQLNDLEFRLAAIDMERITAEIQAENDRIFQGFPELASWAEGLNALATATGLSFSYSVNDAHLSPVPDVLEVPILLSFRRTDNSKINPFTGTTNLVEKILRDHWHIDVLSTQAEGTGDGLASMNINAQVWVRDRFGFIDIATLEPNQTQATPSEPDY